MRKAGWRGCAPGTPVALSVSEVTDSIEGVVSLVAAGVAFLALVVAVIALRRTSVAARRRHSRQVPANLDAVARAVGDLRVDSARALRHLAVVRYDAFGDMGGHMSWSLAILDDEGDGIMLTAIHGRSDTRTYAKNIADWSSSTQLSPEETEAISLARR
ncbi:MAG: DUF4446 family protein [Nocardioidaceae bacterium]|nr:DUF4446 family protein [Nocardioidaceae bacterium]